MRKLFTLLVLTMPILLCAEAVSEDFANWSDNSYGTTSTYTDANGGQWVSFNALVNSSNGCNSSTLRLRDNTNSNMQYNGLDGNGKDEGIGTLSFNYRHWDGDGSTVTFQVQYNQGGAGWTNLGAAVDVTGTTCTSFSNTLDLAGDDIQVRIILVSAPERLMIDDFSITNFLAPAPVELVTFSASKKSSNVALNWSTATELNNDYFIVEHSRDGVNFRTIGEVQGAGTTEFAQSYSFDHDAPARGLNYYRLQQVDYSRATSFSDVELVQFDEAGTLEIYPTLVSDYATVIIEKESGTKNILVYDLTGRVLMNESTKDSGNYNLNLSTLANGTYVIVLRSNTAVQTTKVVKQ